MRRIGLWCAALVFGLGWCALPAAGQFYQQRSQVPRPATPEVHHLSAVRPQPSDVRRLITVTPQPLVTPQAKRSPRAGGNPPASRPRTEGQTSALRSQIGVVPWVVWGSGYPVFWTGTFVPGGGQWPGFGIVDPRVRNAVAPVARPLDAAKAPAPERPPKPEGKPSNADAKARSGKFIGYGDANFGQQKYLAALGRYRTAGQTADDLPEPSFRQGVALVALGQYASAAKAFRRGLRIRSDWSEPPFNLDQLYGDDHLAKTSHQEGLARAVEANPFDSELLVAMAMLLFLDHEPKRAEVFFSRAAQLGGNEERLLDSFLPAPGPAEAPKNPRAGKIVF